MNRRKVLSVTIWIIILAVAGYGISKLVSVISAHESVAEAEDREIRAFLKDTQGAVGEVWIRRVCRDRCDIDDLSFSLEVDLAQWRKKRKPEVPQ